MLTTTVPCAGFSFSHRAGLDGLPWNRFFFLTGKWWYHRSCIHSVKKMTFSHPVLGRRGVKLWISGVCLCTCEPNPIADGRGIISKTIVAGGAAEGVSEMGSLQRLMRVDSATDAFSCEARKHNTVIHPPACYCCQYLADVSCCKSMKSSDGSSTFKRVTGNVCLFLKKSIISILGKVSVV